MSIYSSNMHSMAAAINKAAKSITRDFYEIGRIQSSQNAEGIKRFANNAYNKSQSAITEILQEDFPHFGFSKDDDTHYYWDIKPIDGLYNFSRSIPYFAICISLFTGEDMVAIIISLPAFQEIVWAEKGSGAYLEDGSNTIKLRINSNKTVNDQSLVALSGINGTIFRALESMKYRVIGSKYTSMAHAATGKFDAALYIKESRDESLLIKEAYGNAVNTDKYSIIGSSKVVSTFAENLQNEQRS